MNGDTWLMIGIMTASFISADITTALVGEEPTLCSLIWRMIKWMIKWLACPFWGPIVLFLHYVDRRCAAKKRSANMRAWIKAELTYHAEIQHLAYQQGLIDNDWRLVRAGTYGDYDPVLEAVA